MTSSTTPQDRAVEALVERFQCGSDGIIALDSVNPRDYVACKKIGGGFLDFGAVSLGEIVDCLADAGLLSSGTQEDQGDGSLRSLPPADGSSEADIELVAESLRDFRLRLGPNTVRNIRDGQDSVPLSGRERQDVARVAVEAMRSLEKP